MIIGDRLKTLREGKDLSQGDIEKRTGLLRCYISRVENGHTVPSVETLEKFARALEPLYHLMFDGDKPPALPNQNGSRRPESDPLPGRAGVQEARRHESRTETSFECRCLSVEINFLPN